MSNNLVEYRMLFLISQGRLHNLKFKNNNDCMSSKDMNDKALFPSYHLFLRSFLERLSSDPKLARNTYNLSKLLLNDDAL